ncbi:MAG: zf-HC2 domain-containing protein [Chloroflexi bacterium]|nr:zf-HC2 domain-containing protein [Chloroflexota bacterium]
MTFDRRRHEAWEELISASLHDDLSEEERRRLDAHLETCAQCRATATAFADSRRIVAGLRHVPPPRDLGARVRTGVASRSGGGQAWWRRPPAILAGLGGGLAVITGALLAVVLLGAPESEAPVGAASPTPSAELFSSEPSAALPTLPPVQTPAPSASADVPSSSAAPSPTATPIPASPEPDVVLALTGPFDNLALTVRDGMTGELIQEADTPAGAPVAAELSPDGQWLAYITELGLSGMNEVRATRISEGLALRPDEPPLSSDVSVGDTVRLATSAAGSPFLELLAWSPDARHLAFTVATPGEGTEAWLFEASTGNASALTDVGNAYAATWAPSDDPDTAYLWVSLAGDTPRSHLLTVHAEGPAIEAGDPSASAFPAAENVFQPLVSSNGGLVIYWIGRMSASGDEYLFTEGGAPWLAENRADGRGGFRFESSRPLFSDVTIDRDAFASAAISWGPDSNAYAVWDAAWTGISQGARTYPDRARVYLGRANDPAGLTSRNALDAADVPEGSPVVDVKVAPTGRHLLVTARRMLAGDLSAPSADLLLVTRNLGDEPDEVEVVGSGDDGWFGPAAFRFGVEGDAP